MTLIECFTDSHIDNIAACLQLHPEKLIMLGSQEKMQLPVKRYQELLHRRGLHTEITMCDIRGKRLQDICDILKSHIQSGQVCVIDLTGGDELVIMAVGAVLAGLDSPLRENVHIQKFNHENGTALDCIHNNCRLPGKAPALTVEELIHLHGGRLHPGAFQIPEDCPISALDGLWRIVCEDPKKWNRTISLLNEFESRSASKTQIRLSLDSLRGSIPNFSEKQASVLPLLEKFRKLGIITDHSTWDTLKYTYTSPLLRYCTKKAGNALEVKTLLEGRSVSENGTALFHDCQMSVSIDWDGIIHAPTERIPDTCNEIDVVLIHGTTPLFISCKNGSIGEEELYKLHTVASRFGGPYARKMLIATDLEQKSPAANRAFCQRAWDMDIFLVTTAAELSKTEWQEIFKRVIS